MKYSEYSVIIIGSGASGLYAALKLSSQIKLPEGILLITKSTLGESNSKYAQGGIVGVVHQNPNDSVEIHVNDTQKAGAGLSDKKIVEHISTVSDEVINDLINIGVVFDKDVQGNLNFTLEAAHSFRRILHAGGDATGREIVKTLSKKVLNDENITIQENAIAVEILVNLDGVCKGIILYNELTGEHEIIYSSATILATGGMGQLYKYTTNPNGATADGIDLAYNAGAILQDLEFIQFHPTALALETNNRNRFLISEAVRGEGARLVDNSGNEFMLKYSDKRELAPRDVVTRAIYNEMKMKEATNMYLNASVIGSEKLLQRFPTICKKCLENGIDATKKPIPVAPAAHYSMGGVKATVEGRTSIRGLYAIGEVASTGLHGANRLASNSLLECVACAYELADFLSFVNLEVPKRIDTAIMEKISLYSNPISEDDYNIEDLKQELKDLMWNKVGIIRSERLLKEAKNKIKEMQRCFRQDRKCLNTNEYEYRNMLTAASLIVESALKRKESRGAHSRVDYPQINEVVEHSVIMKNNGEILDYVK